MDYGGGFSTDGGYLNDGGSQKVQQVRSSLTPVTIKQINEAKQPVPDGEFQIHNVDLNMVSFVGIVREVQDLTSNLLITIEDGTGAVEVRKWVDDSNESLGSEISAELNKYVYVTCALKEFLGKTSLQNATIRPITDHNEILYHHLEAIQNHLKAQGLSSGGASSSNGNSNNNGLFVNDAHLDPATSLQNKVLAIIHENTGSMQEGVPVPFISQQLGVSDAIVSENCTALVEEGKIYTGYDDSAYLAI